MRIALQGTFVLIISCFVFPPFLMAENAIAISSIALGSQAIVSPVQKTSPGGLSQPRPVSLSHLYWHFLVYTNVLDSTAAKITAHGKDGSRLRNDLQMRLKFSDADFAPIRASSQRLSSKLGGLDQQEKTIRSAGLSGSNRDQLKALIVQREAYINTEVASLQQALTPDKRASLETFIVQFFAPKKVVYYTPSSTRPQSGKAGSQ